MQKTIENAGCIIFAKIVCHDNFFVENYFSFQVAGFEKNNKSASKVCQKIL